MMTGVGVILGTAAYMSPEQASGKPVDKRSDLWAFGVVLFEMLSGHRLFEGDSVSHVIAAVLKDQPDFSMLPPDTPPPVKRLLRRCLEKDRKRRLADASDARLELDEAMTLPVGDGTSDSSSECLGPFLPREVPIAREADGQRKRLCLPRLGKDRFAIHAGQRRQFGQHSASTHVTAARGCLPRRR